MIDGQNIFDQLVKNDQRTYDNIKKNTIVQGDDYASSSLLDYNYFRNYYKMIAIGFSKQKGLADLKVIKQINFTGNATMFFIFEE